MWSTALLLAFLAPQDLSQDPSQEPSDAALTVALAPAPLDGAGRLRWSPKGAKVALAADGDALVGHFELGAPGTPSISLRLSRGDGASRFDQLWVDGDRDGEVGDRELLRCEPKEQRGKWWSSFETVVSVPIAAEPEAGRARPYPLALWFVDDPREPDAEPVLRWSRRGWHEGTVMIGDRAAHVLITEAVMDGVFDQRDGWALARDAGAARAAGSRRLEQHIWLDHVAYRAIRIDPDGRELVFEAFDPGFTEEEDRQRSDVYAADRAAARAAEPLSFERDLAAALARAAREDRRVLVDFETTWCGPCKLMDQIVYSAQPVVDAASRVICVKLDGDVQRELTRQYAVTAYPTMLLLAADGSELRRAVGYRGVAAMVEFLRP